MENVMYRIIEYVPLGMIGFGIQDFFFIHMLTTFIGHFNHSNINVPLGFLKYVLNNPQMHRWHHAKAFPKTHPHGINFGISLSIWDYIFKTAYVPHDGEAIELGYPGDDEMPANFTGQAVFPFYKETNAK
jgi:sterol desaturase/sphingolipid hydroxylase (fatty acid hydroxylase superfamily)